MLEPSPSVAMALMGFAVLLTVLLVYLYRQKRLGYVRLWAWMWGLVALYYLGPALGRWLPTESWEGPLNSLVLAAAVLVLILSAEAYSQSRLRTRMALVAGLLFAIWALASWRHLVAVPLDFGLGFLLFIAARSFWEEGHKQESTAECILAGALAAWGLTLLATVVDRHLGWITSDLRLLFLLPHVFVGLLQLVSLYEEEKRRVERNMLSLANLNLAASGFTGEEMERALKQALERILRVMRLPTGVLLVSYEHAWQPAIMVSSGISGQFQELVSQEPVGRTLVHLVARLGGVMILRKILQDEEWEPLQSEPAFQQVRQLLMPERLQNAVGISLQARERVFGLLLLGTPKRRQFSAPELRLLLALTHQVAMAAENSYLIQQTARRTEEMNALNEIGRALSSTLDFDNLADRIYSEMRRLFDAENFFIGRFDPARDQIHLDLEVTDGQRCPRHSRPAGNGVIEYILRARKPLLVREDLAAELHRLAIDAMPGVGCFCGVPVVLYDRAVGVMALYSEEERVYDANHLELMQALANSAGIAMENARLFGQEQEKSRHLTLLNNVSRHAIGALNVEQMLARIAEELELGLSFDHIGIGLADYDAKEIVVRAEAGRRREALGRRIPFGEGLIGDVARSGESSSGSAPDGSPFLLLGSVSGVALPIMYAEELLGVLYIETRELHEFTEEEHLLLRTLADLISGALHNARTLQKAQEQAITDGLTGVKTHRYLMEAVSSEWRRATRMGRPFALLLMDLDRFKFVNDHYGHLEGDVVLRRVGRLLEEHCRRSDVVARYGGDEFVILMVETTVDQARQMANKLRGLLASDPLLRQRGITASFGIAAFPVHGSTPEELLERADAAMYLSKRRGGNAVSSAQRFVLEPAEAAMAAAGELPRFQLHHDFVSGPEAFDLVLNWLEEFATTLANQGRSLTPGELPPTLMEGLMTAVRVVDEKKLSTHGHSRRVSEHVARVAEALALDANEIEEMRLAGLLHDIGKIGVPENLLRKSGAIQPGERDAIRQHTVMGWKLLSVLPGMSRVQQIVRHHHEYFDGSGYPDHLAGQRIPQGARLVAIAEVYDAMISGMLELPRSSEQVFAELQEIAGSQFDPALVQVFIQAIGRHALESSSSQPHGS
ncbi:MAG TPA: diguanylate cyclase [Patescibacteria group bacterium]|nr:diguanylate cyclase [Patescibacteria group bacterium]